MGKKMKLPSLFKAKETKQPWQWPSCKHPKTLSFRAGDDMFKTVNSVFFDLTDGVETPESWFTNTSESASFSTESEEEYGVKSVEVVIRGVQSERLFFEPGNTSSILEEKAKAANEIHPFKESVVLAMESEDPYVDFRKSMEEMVESHGLKDWDCLEELLGWYLRVNGKKNHGFIVGAFVDLLVGLASCSDSTSFSSAVSSFSSPISMSSSQQLQDKDIDDKEEDEE
ncbi:transcription repressor OFP13-like [Vitis riparia]|uniref:transcription repressor OFP13-like n=1 Tax=Vitis riparia TaxID=96939 RepID=UPI00155A6E4E|nr:transcription repressor OFP13-like [Vitis riparia]